MRVLLDEFVPRGLCAELPGHEVKTVAEAGWAGAKNGTLLQLAATQFHVLLTDDRNRLSWVRIPSATPKFKNLLQFRISGDALLNSKLMCARRVSPQADLANAQWIRVARDPLQPQSVP